MDDAGGPPLCPACYEQVFLNPGGGPSSAPAVRKRRRKRRSVRTAKRSRQRTLLLGAGAAVLMLAVGLVVFWPRPRAEAAPVIVVTTDDRVPATNADQPPAVEPTDTKVALLKQPIVDVEEAPAPAIEPDFEQLDVMPAVAVEAPAKPARQPGKLVRRRNLTEDDLRDQLAKVPEMGLTVANVQAISDTYDASAKIGATDFQPGVLLQVRPDLATLPVRARQIDSAAAATLGKLSKKLHRYVDNATPKDALGERMDPFMLRQILSEEKKGNRLEWLRPEAVPVLRQILGHEQTPIRAMLVELLTEITGQRASELLAERAVFDLAPDVRASAVAALRPRPREEFRHVLLSALRYPWAPAADHAAEALVALDDSDAVPHLVTLLNQPDPSAPYSKSEQSKSEPRPLGRGDSGLMQRQLVRVNHTASCLMCHPPSLTTHDPVLGKVPGLQRITTGRGGWGGGGQREGASPFWVRADVTFFRQDFSESIPIGAAWLPGQPTMRFDYLVRRRPLGPKEAKKLQEQYSVHTTYEQLEAVLFGLRELTGKNAGPQFEDWLKLYPTAVIDTEAARLIDKLVKAAPGQRAQLLTQLRDGKGEAHTLAIARAIPKLPAAEQAKAREALVKRLARMTADTLRDKLQDADAEVRRAAVAASTQRNDSAAVAGAQKSGDRDQASGDRGQETADNDQ
jgi:nitroreductase